jgi:methylase of polypeptide subunit release factors
MKFDANAPFDTAPAHDLVSRHASLKYPYEVDFAGLRIEVHEHVFSPILTKTSTQMLEAVKHYLGPEVKSVVDVFTGTGIFALVAASHGCAAIGLDISPFAIECAKVNAVRNGLSSKARFVKSDVFSALPDGDTYDLIIGSPPLLPGTPTAILDKALVDPGLGATIQFIKDVGRFLSPKGRALLFLSDVFERMGNDLCRLCADAMLSATTVKTQYVVYETYRVVELRHYASDLRHK